MVFPDKKSKIQKLLIKKDHTLLYRLLHIHITYVIKKLLLLCISLYFRHFQPHIFSSNSTLQKSQST